MSEAETPKAAGDDKAAPREPGAGAKALSASLAKWFVPSAVGLFAVVGYIVQTAQEDLLGTGAVAHASSSYSAAAADFFRDLIGLPLNILLGSLSSLFVYWPSLILIVVTMALMAVPFYAPQRIAFAPRVTPAVVLVLLIFKFFAFDMPLTFVNDIVLGGETNLHSLIDAKFPTQSGFMKGPILARVEDRADRFAYTIACSHLNSGTLAAHGAALGNGTGIDGNTCTPGTNDDDARARASEAAFTIIILLQLAISVAAALLLFRENASEPVVLLALFSFLYVLTVPYDYGKLLKSTRFQYGRVKLMKALTANDGVETSNEGTLITGLIIARDGTETRLLYTEDTGRKCAGGGGNEQAVRMVSLSPSQIMSVAQIESRDIFEWRFSASCQQ